MNLKSDIKNWTQFKMRFWIDFATCPHCKATKMWMSPEDMNIVCRSCCAKWKIVPEEKAQDETEK